MRWWDRLLGLAGTWVLARLLTAADFGLAAMAMVVAGRLDVLLAAGFSTVLIQNERADIADFNAAWTRRLVQSSKVAVLLLAVAPPAATLFTATLES